MIDINKDTFDNLSFSVKDKIFNIFFDVLINEKETTKNETCAIMLSDQDSTFYNEAL